VNRPVPHQSARSAVVRLAVSRAISVGGGGAAYTALLATIFERTDGSAVWLSATLLLTFGVEGLVGPFAGALSDRFERRSVMLISEGSATLCFVAMALADDPVWLLAFAFLSAIAEAPFFSASRAAIPNLIDDPSQLSWANSWVSIGVNSGIMLGPALGGVLVTRLGPSAVFALNAATFVVSMVLVWSVRRPFAGARSEDETTEHRGVVAGFRFIRRDAVLVRITLATAVMVLGLGMAMVADRPLAEHFGVGAEGFGLIISFWGAGSVIGSFLGRRLGEATERRWLVIGMAGISATALAMGVSPAFLPVLAFVLLNGISDAVSIVADQGIKQRRTPDVVRARVMSASESVAHIALALGYALAGPILAATSAQGLYVVAGLSSAVATVVLLPLLRDADAGPPARSRDPVAGTDTAVAAAGADG
jgi:predicted MFS family arabinose efflux permease